MNLDFLARGLHTRTAVARFPLRQLDFLVCWCLRIRCLYSYFHILIVFLSRVREAKLTERNSLQNRISLRRSYEKESCAIAKMAARCSLYSLQRYDNSKLSKMAACRKLGFGVTGNSAIRSADPENPTLEPNTKCIGSPISDHPLWRYGHLSILGHMEPPFWGRGGRMGSAMAPLERAMVVSYRLSIVTVALSVTIRPQFAIECLRRSNQQVGGSLWAKNFRVFHLQ